MHISLLLWICVTYSSTLKMEKTGSFKTLVTSYQTQHHMSEHTNLDHCHKNLKHHTLLSTLCKDHKQTC